MHPDTFGILSKNSMEAGWPLESEMVLLCHFVDQLHARLPGTEDDGILGDFERFLSDQREIEGNQDDIFFMEPPTIPETLTGVITETMPPPLLYLVDEDFLAEYDQNDAKLERWRHAVDKGATTKGLDEWDG